MTVSKQRKKTPELKVVFDTNAIYNGSNNQLFRREVSELIEQNKKHQDLIISWYLPEVVLHERQYQMLQKSLELLPSIQKLERLLGHNLNITETIIEDRVKTTVKKQVEDTGVNILPLTPNRVDLNQLMLASAYRKPPFSTGEKEKGFRDALVGETFIQLVEDSPTTPSTCRIALISGDNLLVDAIGHRIGSTANLRILSDIEGLKGLINTLVAEVSEDFIKRIQAAANSYFFEPKKENTLFYKEKISPRLRELYGKEIKLLPPGAEESEVRNLYVGAPNFVRKERQRVFWANRISIEIQTFVYEAMASAVNPMSTVAEASQSTSMTFPAKAEVYRASKAMTDFTEILRKATEYMTAANKEKKLFKAGKAIFEVT